MEAITLTEALKIIESGNFFSVKVCSYDKKRRANNGRVLHFPEARKESAHQKETKGDIPKELRNQGVRNPYHFDNFTRNIRIYHLNVPTTKVVKIHPLLIMEFNGKKLLL